MGGARQRTEADDLEGRLLDREGMTRALDGWASAAISRDAQPDAAATPIGLRTWIEQFGSEELALLRAKGDAPALLPIERREKGGLGMTLRVWSSPGNFYWHFGYPLIATDIGGSITALLQSIERRRDWDVIELGPLLSCSSHYAALCSTAEAMRMQPETHGSKHAPVVVVGGSWPDYYARLDSRLKGSIEVGSRRLARLGEVSLQCYTGGPDLSQRLREFFDLEASGWKGREGTAIASDPSVEAFYTGLAREAAAQGSLRLYTLRAGDKLVAGDFTIACGEVIHMLKIAYDEQQRRCSPGHVIRKLVLRQLFDRGEPATYDLMTGGGEHGDYKLHWATGAREYVMLRLFNPATLRGRLARWALASRNLLRNARRLGKPTA